MTRGTPGDPSTALERAYRLQLEALDALRRASAAALAAARRLEVDDSSLARATGDDALVSVRRERLAAEIADLRARRDALEGASVRLSARISLFRTERAALEARLASRGARSRADERLAALDAALATAARDVAAARAELAVSPSSQGPRLERATDDAFSLEDVRAGRRGRLRGDT